MRWTLAALLAGSASAQGFATEQAGAPLSPYSPSPQDVHVAQYDSTRTVYVQAYALKTELDNSWSDTLDRLEEARASGAGARERGSLVARANELSDELLAATRAVVTAKTDWCEAGNRLIHFIDARLASLDLLDAIPPAYVTLDAQLRDVETEMGKRGRDLGILPDSGPCGIQELPPFPEVRVRPGDTPEEIETKAQLLDGEAERLKDEITAIDAEIGVLENQQARARRLAAYRAEQEGFGRGDPVEDQVSEGVDREEELPVEVRIDNLERLKSEIEKQREELLARAEEFRSRIGGAR